MTILAIAPMVMLALGLLTFPMWAPNGMEIRDRLIGTVTLWSALLFLFWFIWGMKYLIGH